MRDMLVETFCRKHGACGDGITWARSTGCRWMSELWNREDMQADWRMWIITRPGVASDRDLRLFACRCARDAWHMMTDDRSRLAVRVSERYARGRATVDELDTARAAASAAYWAARAAASAAYWAARAAASAAWAARAAAWDAARAKQTRRMMRMWPQPFEKRSK